MLINWLELTDFTSHANTRIDFSSGMNGIVGMEGSGKTSIVTAIGIALFNFNPYNQKNLIRRGHKIATIELSFNSLVDSQEYHIKIYLGGSSDAVLATPDGEPIARGKTDVYNVVRHHLGLPPETDLASLTENGIITRQGELVGPFVARPSERKAYFSDLLGVDTYEKAWSELAKVAKLIDAKLAEIRESSARLEGELRGMEGIEEALEKTQVIKQELETLLVETEEQVESLKIQVSQNEEQAAANQQARLSLARQDGLLAQVQAKIKSGEELAVRCTHNLDDIVERERFVEQNSWALNDLIKIEAELEGVRQEKAERDGLVAGDIARLEKQNVDLAEADSVFCPTCNQPLSAERIREIIEENERSIRGLRSSNGDDRELVKAIAVLSERVGDLSRIKTQIVSNKAIISSRPRLENELATCQKKIEDLIAEQAVIQSEITHLESKLKLSSFDKTKHDSATRALTEAVVEVGKLKTQLSNTENVIDNIEKRLIHRDKIVIEKSALTEHDLDLNRRKLKLAQIRDAIRQAGPIIASRIVASVSASASVSFAELMREHQSASLEWSEDYGIKVTIAGNELDMRDDHVNGGTKTKAALAVRMALLDQLGSIGFIILDEPTTNLDDTSKHNLAASIGKLCSRFGQGIVISHSDEFGSTLNNVVRLSIRNGITEVI